MPWKRIIAELKCVLENLDLVDDFFDKLNEMAADTESPIDDALVAWVQEQWDLLGDCPENNDLTVSIKCLLEAFGLTETLFEKLQDWCDDTETPIDDYVLSFLRNQYNSLGSCKRTS